MTSSARPVPNVDGAFKRSPVDGDFNRDANWEGGHVPNGMATIRYNNVEVFFSEKSTTLRTIHMVNAGMLNIASGRSVNLRDGLDIATDHNEHTFVGGTVNGNVQLSQLGSLVGSGGTINGNLDFGGFLLDLVDANSQPSTLTVNGSYTQQAIDAPPNTLQLRLAADGRGSRLVVNGPATFAKSRLDNAVVRLVDPVDAYRPSRTYTVVNAKAGITGQLMISYAPGASIDVRSDATNIYVTLTPR
jgi:hypothetical protein